jgi:predicted nucleic acid-binding protein
MIVVADTSPINYLILIEQIHVLPQMYGSVVIPQAVRDELKSLAAPDQVRSWIGQPPMWLEIRIPQNISDTLPAGLDPGERDAILLAVELHADQLIVDDRQGRQEAQKLGIPVVGTLGVLKEAAIRGLLDLRKAVARLQSTSFHVSPEILERLLTD